MRDHYRPAFTGSPPSRGRHRRGSARSNPMDVGANTASSSAANYLLEGLHEVGIDYLFCNMGTDHAPIIEAMASRRKRGQAQPKVIVCPHENTAAHMAGGYALATGRGQGVLVHVDVGTANTTNAMH